MSLDKIQLPEILIAELYKNNLVELPELPADTSNTKEISLVESSVSVSYLGDHLRKTTILVHYPDDLYIAETQLAFLANVLKACHLNLADIAIINLARQQTSLKTIKSVLNPEHLLSFGIQTPFAGVPELPYFTIVEQENISMFNAPALEAFSINNEESKLLKTKLWFCLKELFKVSQAS